ncbi:MAG: thioredoxin domain-containing protein [Acidobacteriia bacterium]|nr:thioredoxin domain-containing protein [Terriglobia bacterium]
MGSEKKMVGGEGAVFLEGRDKTCHNLHVHPWARKAAVYAECVAANNASLFWTLVDEVYAHQDGINVPNAESQLRLFIKSRGGDDELIARCAGTQEVEHQLAASIQLGKEIGVTGTPSIFVDGRRIYNFSAANYALLNKAIQHEIP